MVDRADLVELRARARAIRGALDLLDRTLDRAELLLAESRELLEPNPVELPTFEGIHGPGELLP